jgi:DNA replication protein DnaC
MQDYSYIKNNCKECNGKGYIWNESRLYLGEKENEPKQCECLKKMLLYERLNKANVLREFFDLTIDNFKVNSKEKLFIKEKMDNYLNDINSFMQNGKSIFFYGPKGTGKSLLSNLLIKKAVEFNYSAYYDFMPTIIQKVTRKGYKADDISDQYDQIFEEKDILVLDEIGKELDSFPTQHTFISRFLEINILKKRGNKTTIFVSNFENGREDIKKYYGQYVASMMAPNFEFIEVPGFDYRES